MPYNVGIIGYGLSAKIFHIPFVNAVSDFKLYAIVQRSPKPDDDAEKDNPGIKAYKSTDDLFADPKVDLVVVSTAPESHFALVKQALEAGKHVVVEKPFTPLSTEANELIKIAESKDRLLVVYQNRRFDADFLTVQKLLSSPSPLGRVAEFETHFDRHRPEAPSASTWKAVNGPGHGVVYDLGTHLMDQVVVLFGFPQRITGFVVTTRENNTTDFEDSATILLHYDATSSRPAPLLATVKATVVSPETNQLRYWIRGTKGSFKKFHLDVQEDQLKAGLRPNTSPGYAVEDPDHYGTLSTLNADNSTFKSEILPTTEPTTYCEFYRKVASALNKKDKSLLPVDPKVAAGVIRLVELARESSKLGKTLDVDL